MKSDSGKKEGHGQHRQEKEPATEATGLAQAVKEAHKEGRMEPPTFSEDKSKSKSFFYLIVYEWINRKL